MLCLCPTVLKYTQLELLFFHPFQNNGILPQWCPNPWPYCHVPGALPWCHQNCLMFYSPIILHCINQGQTETGMAETTLLYSIHPKVPGPETAPYTTGPLLLFSSLKYFPRRGHIYQIKARVRKSWATTCLIKESGSSWQ